MKKFDLIPRNQLSLISGGIIGLDADGGGFAAPDEPQGGEEQQQYNPAGGNGPMGSAGMVPSQSVSRA